MLPNCILLVMRRELIRLSVRKTTIIISVLVIIALLSGCSQANEVIPDKPKSVTETIKLFYANADNDQLIVEDRMITYQEGDDKYTVALQALINGPESSALRANLSPNTKILGTNLRDNQLTVDVSRDFAQFGGSMAEILGVGSLVNTMTQFEEIEQVKILVEGNELIGPSGEPRGFMTTFPLTADGSGEPAPIGETEQATVVLYFGNQQATAVKGESRMITFTSDISQAAYAKILVAELLKGPLSSDLYPTIPSEARILGVQINNSTAYVDFSSEMHTKHSHGAAGESMTINSIVNTLTELDYIRLVQITVEGEPLAIEHIIMDEPMARNESMIE